MPVKFKNNVAKFTDLLSIEDAETLFNWFIKKKKPKIDLSKLNHLHTACLQLLLIFKPKIIALPEQKDLKMFFNAWEET
uniref:Uncharacterized protein n=1 Tax=Thermodesulfobacterium geofontis TaxID=1295609 RepID=A0A7V6CE59_9BACT